MSEDNTTLYAGIVVALIIGAAVGYFVYPSMNPVESDSPPQTQSPTTSDHNHFGIWFILMVIVIVLGLNLRYQS